MIDIGANLTHDSFNSDREAVLERAWQAGLNAIVITGSSIESAQQALKICAAHPEKSLFTTAGLHPHHADDWSQDCEQAIREIARNPAVVSLGECGLDYFRTLSKPESQRKALRAQLELAASLRKPLFLHQRDAHEDFLGILREFRPHLSQVCIHCFTDTAQAAEDYLALDCHIGITGWICDERRGASLVDIVKQIPEDRLMIETDAPYLLPRNLPKTERPRNARRNEPAFLPYVAQKIAEARGDTVVRIQSLTETNARRFFGI